MTTLTRGWTLGAARREMEEASLSLMRKPAPSRHGEGQIIDAKYRLEHLIGDGGMGEVWLAKHLALDADVAVKFTRGDLLDETVRERLVREGRMLARLNHPSIVRVLDSGTTESGSPYMVMELLRGPSLGETIDRRGRLSPSAAVRVLLPVASALAAAHAQGIVHRDLKPDNIILIREGSGAIVPKVLDFGIAKAAALEGSVTREGTLIGSPDYMSPEQAAGGADVDARTDVWSFCLVLYELVSGRQPFARPTLGETLQAIVHEPLPPLDEAEVDDLTLWAIVGRGLMKQPDHRWPTIQDVGRELARWATARGIREDSAGASIRAQWLAPTSRPLSDAPGPDLLSSFVPPPILVEAPPLPAPPRARRSTLRRVVMVLVPAVALGLLAAGAVQMAGCGPHISVTRAR